MGSYKFYNDIKEEQQLEEQRNIIQSFFKFDNPNYSGPINLETEEFITRGIVKNGLPHGLIIIHFKKNENKLHSFFHEGIPYGEWVLYDKGDNVISKKKMIRKELM